MLHGKEIIVRVPEDCELHGTIARRHCPAVDTLAANAELRLSTFTISSMREYISDMQLLGAPTEGFPQYWNKKRRSFPSGCICWLPANALWLTSAEVIPITESVEENHFRRQDSTLNVEKTKGFCPR